jgi:hypothetical protein
MIAKSNEEQKRKGQGFPKGTSGNPSGRPAGSRNKATLLAQELLDGEVEGLVRKAIDQALAGDTMSLRLCLERLVPPRKDAPVSITLPVVRTTADLPGASQAILQAVADGQLTPSEAHAISGIIADHGKNLELGDLAVRLDALEQRLEKEV